jgi:octaprenyl-diphosphate synthase
LPLILTRKQLGPEQQSMIDESIRHGGIRQIEEIHEIIRSSGALKESMKVATRRSKAAKKAIGELTDSPWKNALMDLASYSVSRRY